MKHKLQEIKEKPETRVVVEDCNLLLTVHDK